MSPVRIRLRELREARGMTQAEVATHAGVRAATVSAIENGKTKGIDFETLQRLAEALEVDPALLIVRGGPDRGVTARRPRRARS